MRGLAVSTTARFTRIGRDLGLMYDDFEYPFRRTLRSMSWPTTTPEERTRALRYAREVLHAILDDSASPPNLKKMAAKALEHYPEFWEIARWARHPEFTDWLAPES